MLQSAKRVMIVVNLQALKKAQKTIGDVIHMFSQTAKW